MKKFVSFLALSAASFCLIASSVMADTTLSNSTTSAQSITSAGTFTINKNVTLNVSGSTAAFTFDDKKDNDSVTLTNNGTVEQNKTGFAVVDDKGNLTVTINNNARGSHGIERR